MHNYRDDEMAKVSLCVRVYDPVSKMINFIAVHDVAQVVFLQ